MEKALLAAIEEGVSWFSYRDTHDLDPNLRFEPPLEYSLGLLTNDGRVKARSLNLSAPHSRGRAGHEPHIGPTWCFPGSVPESSAHRGSRY